MKVPYICGPLTELPLRQRKEVKRFYELLADACQQVLGDRAFVPHEHFDPIKQAHFTPRQVDEAERRQVCEETSLLIVVAIAPSWGGGIEVEMANKSGVPVMLLCEKEKLGKRMISRLLRGNPAVIGVIPYDTIDEALELFRDKLSVVLAAAS